MPMVTPPSYGTQEGVPNDLTVASCAIYPPSTFRAVMIALVGFEIVTADTPMSGFAYGM